MRLLLVASLLGLLVFVSLSSADLVTPRPLESKERVAGMSVRPYVELFKGNERALVMASGDSSTCLAVYVFDGQGNCVAKDDLSYRESSDDLAAEWIPPATARYSVEIRNGGLVPNVYQMAIR